MVAKWKLKFLLIWKDCFIVGLFWKFYIKVCILKTSVLGYYGGIFFSYKEFMKILLLDRQLYYFRVLVIYGSKNFSIHPELLESRVLG